MSLHRRFLPAFALLLSLSGIPAISHAALTAAMVWEIRDSATTGNVNGAGWDGTVASPGTDFSQQDTAQLSITDLVIGADNTTVTSVGNPFGATHPGNVLHITAGTNFTTGWYVVLSVTATVAQLDRACGTAAATGGTAYLGGAGRLNGLEDAFFEALPASSVVHVKNGSYTISGNIAVIADQTSTTGIKVIGYNATRGDSTTGTNRPLIVGAANSLQFQGDFYNFYNLRFTTTATSGFLLGNGTTIQNIKVQNSSTTAGRFAISTNQQGIFFSDCEAVAQNGTAIAFTSGSDHNAVGCYAHDSSTGLSGTNISTKVIGSIFEANDVAAMTLSVTTGQHLIGWNTIYGREAKIGIGINLTGATSPKNRLINNIIYGFTTGVSVTTSEANSNMGILNDYFNNTTNATNYTLETGALTSDPTFTGATQITGTTATTSGSVLTQSGGDFSTVTDGIDYLHVISGTGVTTGIYLVDSHAATTLTVNNALGTSSAGDVVYFVTTGHNFAIGTNLKAAGFQSFSNMGIETTGYVDVGGVQRQEAGSSATTAYTFVGN